MFIALGALQLPGRGNGVARKKVLLKVDNYPFLSSKFCTKKIDRKKTFLHKNIFVVGLIKKPGVQRPSDIKAG